MHLNILLEGVEEVVCGCSMLEEAGATSAKLVHALLSEHLLVSKVGTGDNVGLAESWVDELLIMEEISASVPNLIDVRALLVENLLLLVLICLCHLLVLVNT